MNVKISCNLYFHNVEAATGDEALNTILKQLEENAFENSVIIYLLRKPRIREVFENINLPIPDQFTYILNVGGGGE